MERRLKGEDPPTLAESIMWVWALESTLCVMELYGGIRTGLAAALKAGCMVRKWIYVEKDPVVRRMATHHAQLLLEEYPQQLLASAIPAEEDATVDDVRDITEEQLGRWGQIDLIVAGWECQGYSRAGEGRGMEDARGASFRDLKRVLEMVQKKQGEVLYILESVDLAEDRREPVKRAFVAFVPNFSRTAAVLDRLLREEQAWQWEEAEHGAMEALLRVVKTTTVLTPPSEEDPFVLYTDWSSVGMGAILCQQREGQEMVVAFASRSCIPAEANYCSYEGEGLVAMWGVTHFRVYLQGRPFVLVTDHQPLTWLMTNQALTGRNVRWAMRLQEYEFTIRHRPGKTLQHVDGLSRNPPPVSPTACLVAMARDIGGEGAQRKQERGPEDVWEDTKVLRWIQGKTTEAEPASERARATGAHYRWYQEQLQKNTKEGWKLVPKREARSSIIAKVHR
ncbi:unnamed protein product [Closterium sp. NIES-53]